MNSVFWTVFQQGAWRTKLSPPRNFYTKKMKTLNLNVLKHQRRQNYKTSQIGKLQSSQWTLPPESEVQRQFFLFQRKTAFSYFPVFSFPQSICASSPVRQKKNKCKQIKKHSKLVGKVTPHMEKGKGEKENVCSQTKCNNRKRPREKYVLPNFLCILFMVLLKKLQVF